MRLERWLYGVPARLRSLFRRQHVEQDLQEELRYHLDASMQASMDRGASETQARRAAMHALGGLEQAKEQCRDVRSASVLDTLLQDLRYGARTLRKNPGYTAVAALTLAIGLGANTAIFSLVNGILLTPLPYSDSERLVRITGTYPKGGLVALRERVRTMEVAGYVDGHELALTGQGDAIRLSSAFVSAELFSVLGAPSELGRTFQPGEDIIGRDNVVILSYALWQQKFGGDPGIVGRILLLDGMPRQVVGVMPPDFRFPSMSTQAWVPLRIDRRANISFWADDFMPLIGRLRPNVTIEAAHTEVRLLHPQVAALFPWRMPTDWNKDVGASPLRDEMVAGVRARLLMLLGAVGLVLLIACANVANLTLSRAATRARETAVRAALGANRRRIIRQLLTESVLLGGLGGLLGLALATQGLALLKATLPAHTPRLQEVQMDWRVLMVTAVLALVTGIIFGLAPALQGSRTVLVNALKSGGRGPGGSVPQRLRSALVVAQVALAVLLVIGVGLLIRGVWALSTTNPGFQSDRVVTARITPNRTFCREAPRCLAFYRDVLAQAQAAPGVTGAALVNTLPLQGRVGKRNVVVEGFVAQGTSGAVGAPLFWLNAVSADYVRVMGIPVLAGRGFTEADVSGQSRVALVDASTARRYWPGENPIGKHLRLIGTNDSHVVVGVVGDVKAFTLQERIPDWMLGMMYVPYNADATLEDNRVPAAMTLAVRTTLSEGEIASTVGRLVRQVNQDVPVSDVKSMRTVVAEAVSAPTATATLLGAFAGVALVLGMIGIYGVLSFLVAKRTHEIGLRLALGAQRRHVLWLVVKEAARLAGVGIVLGLGAAFALTRLLSQELYGVSPLDPATYVGVAATMAVVTLLACCIPTIRGMRVDPLTALRHD